VPSLLSIKKSIKNDCLLKTYNHHSTEELFKLSLPSLSLLPIRNVTSLLTNVGGLAAAE